MIKSFVPYVHILYAVAEFIQWLYLRTNPSICCPVHGVLLTILLLLQTDLKKFYNLFCSEEQEFKLCVRKTLSRLSSKEC